MAQFSVPSLILKAINHLVEQEKWAHDLLLSRENQIIAISLPVGNFQLMIQNGLLAKVFFRTELMVWEYEALEILVVHLMISYWEKTNKCRTIRIFTRDRKILEASIGIRVF